MRHKNETKKCQFVPSGRVPAQVLVDGPSRPAATLDFLSSSFHRVHRDGARVSGLSSPHNFLVTSQPVNPSLRCPARSRTHEKNIAQRRAGVHSWQGASSCRCRRFVFDLFGQAKPLAWAVVFAHTSHMESTRPARVNAHSHMPPWTDTPSPSQRPPPHMHRTSPHGRSIIRRRPWSVCQRRMVLCSS